MDHKKAKSTLAKLNVLFSTVEDSEEEVSKIEKDLMLSYIRQLYESILDGQDSAFEKDAILPKKESRKKVKKKKKPEAKGSSAKTSSEKPKDELVVDKLESPSTDAQDQENIVTSKAKNGSNQDQANEKGEIISAELLELFDIQEATELSEKLGQLPIKDLTKSMGINEKIFTVKELFGGDKELFNAYMSKLNDFKDFEEAKTHMINGPAKDFNWSEESKLKKAQHFIKLVYRRYK